ncbi:MAG: rRNA maturation RNase YbeY [Bacteroidetes bacterium]|nr:rRNA maturation RNase YbeY [Bacteroidota bacterium]MBS1974313.1 rRNA maturation RNase YbeY [Bacteroidota bacterium]
MTNTLSKVSFHFSLYKQVYLPNREQAKACIEKIFHQEKKKLIHISYIFCSDDYLLQINRRYLQHDFYTDIITFDLSETKGVIGEVYISVERVKENSKKFKTSVKLELGRVIVHGALHLSGYNDKTTAQKKEMKQKEDFYLSLLFK